MLLYERIFPAPGVPAARVFSLMVLAVLPLLLAACSLAPVYGDRASADRAYNLAFKSPGSRLEQIVVDELVARFGRSTDPAALVVAVKVSSSPVQPGPVSVSVQGQLTVTDPASDEPVFVGTRTASASYTKSGQSLANQQAANEAAERAAFQLAETIRLTLLGVLLNREQQDSALPPQAEPSSSDSQ
ncbi:MAG TPA: hypothetical protein ENJ90_11085 [Devosia sp.]|nr:hypothetical protein [Devosia sp.]